VIATALGRLLYGLVALPLRLASAVPGRKLRRRAAALRARAARRLLPAGLPSSRRAIVGEMAAFVLVAPATAVFLVRGVAYPLVTSDASDSWGGPTMAGAWAVHAALGLPLLAAVALVARPLLARSGPGVTTTGAPPDAPGPGRPPVPGPARGAPSATTTAAAGRPVPPGTA
jgi:hypothetical protein